MCKNASFLVFLIALCFSANSIAATVSPELAGYQKNGDWTYTSDDTYEGSCSTDPDYYDCSAYSFPMRFCDIDGLYGRLRSDTDLTNYLWDVDYNLEDDDDFWEEVNDDYDCNFVIGSPNHWDCYGKQWQDITDWDGPGLSHLDMYMSFGYKFSSGGVKHRRMFYGDSCYQIEE